MGGHSLRAVLGAAVLAAAGSRAGGAAVFVVSTEAQLQAALTAAQSNGQADTIQLAAGVYDTNDNGGATFFYGVVPPSEPFALTLEGADAATTFLDGNFARRPLWIVANGAVTVRDLTVRNAVVSSAVLLVGAGAAIEAQSGDVRVEDCVFSNNSATANGGDLIGGALALGTIAGTVILQNTVFSGNQAHQTGDGALVGGAVGVLDADHVVVQDCEFTGQTSRESGEDGLIGGALATSQFLGGVPPLTTTLTNLEFSGLLIAEADEGVLSAGVLAAAGDTVDAAGIAIANSQLTESGIGDVFAGPVGIVGQNGNAALSGAAVTGTTVAESGEGTVSGGLIFLLALNPPTTATLDQVVLADNAVTEVEDGDVIGGLVLAAADTIHVADLDLRRQVVSEGGLGEVLGGGISNVTPGIPTPPVNVEFLDISVLDSTLTEADEGSLTGGLIVASGGSVTARRWTVMGSTAAETGDGDAIGAIAAVSTAPSGTLEAARLTGNSVTESGAGSISGGVLFAGGPQAAGETLVINSAIGNNTIAEHDDGDASGGGVGAVGALVRLVHDSIWDNVLTQDGPGSATGGGVRVPVFFPAPVTLDLYNSIVWGNSAAAGADIFVADGTTLNLFNTDFAVQADDGTATVNQGGNLNVDPLFVGFATGDFHLTSLSPVIDEGSAAAPDMPAADFDGDSRILGPAPDMGADELSALTANQPPVNALPGPQTTDVNTPIVFSVANGNPISISDPDAGGNPVRITLVASHGTLTLSGTAGLTFLVGDGTADAAMSFTGTIAAINAALAGLVFDPEPGYSGPASLDITTDDLGNTGAGGPLSDSDTLAIEVARPLSVVEIPTLGRWGLLLLASGLAFAAAWRLR